MVSVRVLGQVTAEPFFLGLEQRWGRRLAHDWYSRSQT